MFSSNNVFALACGVAAVATGANAATINSLATDTFNLTCGEPHLANLAYSTVIIDQHINSGLEVGTCETSLKSNKYAILGQDYGNYCGACVEVTIGQRKVDFVVFDHVLDFTNETKDNMLLSKGWLEENGFNPNVPQPVSWKLIQCPVEQIEQSSIKFSDNERTSFSFIGVPTNVASVTVVVDGTTTPIECKRRNVFSNYWTTPWQAHDKNFVVAITFKNGESAYVAVSTNYKGKGPFEITYYNKDIQEIEFSDDCNITATPVVIDELPEFEEFPEFEDSFASPSAVASATLAVVFVAFACIF